MNTIAFLNLNNIGFPEMMVVLVLGLLLFGKRLPEVGRSLGKGIVEFKRGLKGMSDEIEEEASKPASQKSALPHTAQTIPPVSETREDARVSRSDRVED
jgi:sec-independent protein translocase protein TatA